MPGRGTHASGEVEAVYAPAAVARMTGISAHALRAWERRYRAVSPGRTRGGARRYSERDVRRLRLLRRAVDAGHPIGQVAVLPDDEVARRLAWTGAEAAPAALPVEAILEHARRLDVDALERSLALHLATLGPRSFALDLALPLLRRIGDEWERGALSVASEHAASTALRSLLGATLRRDAALARGPMLVFATPAGERHELGALVAATYALGLGASAVFLGPDLPAAELASAARRLGAAAVALGCVGPDRDATRRELVALRRALPDPVRVWLGGAGAESLGPIPGIERVHRLEELEEHVSAVR